MSLKSLLRFRRRPGAADGGEHDQQSGKSLDTENKERLRGATRTRRNAIAVVSLFYLVAIVFLILVRVDGFDILEWFVRLSVNHTREQVEIGNTRGSPISASIYFFKLDLTNVLARSVPTSLTLQNSLARTLGLHDFYQVGLWNFCEGYNDGYVTDRGAVERRRKLTPRIVELIIARSPMHPSGLIPFRFSWTSFSQALRSPCLPKRTIF